MAEMAQGAAYSHMKGARPFNTVVSAVTMTAVKQGAIKYWICETRS